MSAQLNNDNIIQHLTSQPNDLFSSLKIYTVKDFITKINELLSKSSKIPNKENINTAGFAILKELIIKKITDKISSITDESEIKKLKERFEFFQNDFLDNFVSDLPLPTTTNPINTGYTNFYKQLFKLQNTKIRKLIEKTSPTKQCNDTIGARKEEDICYLCGCNLKNIHGKKRRRDDIDCSKSLDFECEHILPIFPAITHIMLYQTRYLPPKKELKELKESKELKELLQIEYGWSHMCCNQVKSDLNFTLYNPSTKKYQINEVSIETFNKKLKTATYNCAIIKACSCKNDIFPNTDQLIKSKIDSILELINANLKQIKDLTDEQIAHEYYILLMKYKLIAAFTQNTMEEILFFGNEELLEQNKLIKNKFLDEKKRILIQVKEENKRIKQINKNIQKKVNYLRAHANSTRPKMPTSKATELEALDIGEMKGQIVTLNKTIGELTQQLTEKTLQYKIDIKNLTGEEIEEINDKGEEIEEINNKDEDDEEGKGEGKKKKKTKKRRKAGARVKNLSKKLSHYNYYTKKLNTKTFKRLKPVKSNKSNKSNTMTSKSNKSVKSNKSIYDYKCFIYSLLSNKNYQPSIKEIRQVIKNKFT